MKKTTMVIHEDQYKHVTSTMHGHNLNCIQFNLNLIMMDYPKIAFKIMEISEKLPFYKEK